MQKEMFIMWLNLSDWQGRVRNCKVCYGLRLCPGLRYERDMNTAGLVAAT